MGGEGIVYNPVDWRHATTTELEGQRVIARFDNGTVVDGTIIIAPGGAIGVYMGVMVPIIMKAPSGLLEEADHVSALQVLDCSKENSMPDERIEKAAIAVFAAQTNWADFNPSEEQIRDLWDGQMDAIHDSFRRLAKAALDSQEDQPADLDWENVEPKVLDSRMVKAVTVDGTIVRGRTVAVHGSLDQLIVEGILQPLLMRLPGEHWRLASGWKSLVFYNKTKEQ